MRVGKSGDPVLGKVAARSDAGGPTGDSCRRHLRWPLEAASRRKYLLTDHLGSVAAITDDQGTLLDQQRYLPFGQERPNVGSIAQTDFGYTGQRDLAGMGLMDYKSRAYDPLLMRFIQPDTVIPNPADPQGWNRYSYVRNNPLYYVDSSGNFGVPSFIAAVVLGAVAALAYEVVSTPAIQGPRAPAPTERDVTTWLVERLNSNSQAPVTQALRENLGSPNVGKTTGALKGWVGMVRTGGIWDYKGDILLSRVAQNGNVVLGSEKLNYQAVANINYGFMASRVGLPRWVAEAGAGAFQILSRERGSLRTWGDDPFDNYMIKFGYDLAESSGSAPDALTKESFTKSLSNYISRRGRPPKPLEEGW